MAKALWKRPGSNAHASFEVHEPEVEWRDCSLAFLLPFFEDTFGDSIRDAGSLEGWLPITLSFISKLIIASHIPSSLILVYLLSL